MILLRFFFVFGYLTIEVWLADASLRERLNKIMASDYFTTTPEMKAPVDMAAAAASGNYAPFQVPVTGPVQVESQEPQYEQKVNAS